ncbi:winged helix-turn-helix transcriptional regulator [Nocardia bovistercoris]|uniref:Helix-turn-helix transcriptional regulator n=1 Tax=Nocardia bovistercoris TaxID=2785916 RepID=A0A931N059_9NOCA|nr:helix-turn-helix domain-containing protein [Nocardia bovistercoris]MBH0774709.1 helix-turn-helix transcriptional regulator [Nocardia bovistercoris]
MVPDSDPRLLADCRARLALDLLANTWNGVVLWALRDGPRRHGELRGHIGGVSAKVLTETVRRLEYNGLVTRTSGRYTLTPLGRSLLDPIERLGQWADQHGDEVLDAQQRADLSSRDIR